MMAQFLARVTPRERRTVVTAASILLVAWLSLRVVPAASAMAREQRLRTDLMLMTVARARAAVQDAPAMRDALDSAARRLVAATPRLLSGGTTAEAAAELSGIVSSSAALRQVRIAQVDARPDSTASVFTRLSLRVSADGDAAGIGGWIADLEEGTRLIRIRSLAISAPEPTAAAGQAERLRVEIVLEGWTGVARNP